MAFDSFHFYIIDLEQEYLTDDKELREEFDKSYDNFSSEDDDFNSNFDNRSTKFGHENFESPLLLFLEK